VVSRGGGGGGGMFVIVITVNNLFFPFANIFAAHRYRPR
jgi:hypothetical protein